MSYGGTGFKYRGFSVKNNKKDRYLEIYDKRGNLMSRVDNFGQGCVSEAKCRIDVLIKRYGDAV